MEKIIEKGLPDGRKRFILYVLSAYLVNVKRLSEEEAIQVVRVSGELLQELQQLREDMRVLHTRRPPQS